MSSATKTASIKLVKIYLNLAILRLTFQWNDLSYKIISGDPNNTKPRSIESKNVGFYLN